MSFFGEIGDRVKDFFGPHNEFLDSTSNVLEERISSPFYGYVLVAAALLNWKLLYIALLIDQETLFEKTGLLRNEYIDISMPTGLWAFMYFFAGPLILSIIFAWVMPHISRIYFRKNIRNQKALKLIELQENQQVAVEKKNLVEEESKLLAEELKLAKQTQTAREETPEVVWDKEFKTLMKAPIAQKFTQIIDSIYKRNGRISQTTEYGRKIAIDTDILVYADSNGLITLDQPSNMIHLTDKGKYYLKKYVEIQNQLPQ